MALGFSFIYLVFITAKLSGMLKKIKNLKDQTKKDYLWSRSDNFFDKNFKAEKIIVHGHTPEPDITNYPYRINIDTGCYFTGKLSCVCLSDKENQRKFIESN